MSVVKMWQPICLNKCQNVRHATADSTNLCILCSSFDDYDFHHLQFSLFIIISIGDSDTNST
jgi:hypothetical protein